MSAHAFECICVERIVANATPAVAAGAARAGGIGIVDVEFVTRVDDLVACIDRVPRAGPRDRVGLRLAALQVRDARNALDRLGDRAQWLIVSADEDEQALRAAIDALPSRAARRVIVEVTDVEQTRWCDGLPVRAIVAKGNEAGGRVAEDTAFVLLQKLLALAKWPVYVRGGIGVYGAAACRAIGAAGVVLDDQLLLLSESSLPRRWFGFFEQLSGKETAVVADAERRTWRVLPRPGRRDATGVCDRADIGVDWDEVRVRAWPIGQAIGLAAGLRDRYRTTGRVVRAYRAETAELLDSARHAQVFAPGAPLARSHGTRYPIVQGPMTRVSDTAAFAEAVADAGALPLIALALMRGEQTASVLQQTAQRLDGRPWGVGLLGFVPQALRDEQVQVILRAKPPFAVIAGGRPDQSRELEAAGIPTYLHVPSPQLLELFLEEGARRFVFEGRECGGHVGPFSSLVLWERIVATLLAHRAARPGDDLHVLFAGGIHDARSAAMASVIAAPLAAHNVRVGLLMGTAYLFTKEAVDTGAIVEGFQRQALGCTRTATLETGPGHLTRCAWTPFVEQFAAVRAALVKQGEPPDRIRDALEGLNIGRLRIASKGLARTSQGDLVSVDAATQFSDGMYMMGQVATQRDRVTTIAELHRDVSQGSTEWLASIAAAPARVEARARPSDVAIIGIGVLLPGADSVQAYWQNIVDKRCAIREVPRSRFDWRVYYDGDRHARDRIYSKWGGFIDEVPFDPTDFGIPPNSLSAIDPMQLLALETVRRALVDAGYPDGGNERERTAVIFGVGGGLGDLGLLYGVRAELPRVNETNSSLAFERLPEWTEESFPGCLLNVAAGRVANRFDFGGPNFVVDAACASSLAAIDLAVRELDSRRSDLAIAGGVDTLQGPFAFLCFSKTQALSPRGAPRTFDRDADGIVISEGVAVLVLKRLRDAERDGDRIYAVIKAIGSSSDGRALGLTAPLPDGQMLALRRAYARAGMSPSMLGLIETHGTGTPVGDRAEAETIVRTLQAAYAAPHTCAIGSVKTLIGHTKAAAGAAGIIKAALAIHHRVLPPHAGVEHPIAPLREADCPAYLLSDAKPWLRRNGSPRLAGVSAFGFGGTNFHAVLEEYDGDAPRARERATSWPCELVVLRASTREALRAVVDQVREAIVGDKTLPLSDVAYSCVLRSDREAAHAPFCVAVVADTIDTLASALQAASARLRGGGDALPASTQMTEGERGAGATRLALLFPGQGSQYPDMLREAALYLEPLRGAIERAQALLRESLAQPLGMLVFPPAAFSTQDEALARARLTDTHVAQPAIGAIEAGLVRILQRLRVEPAMVAGHSYGEYAALHAAGALSESALIGLSEARGRLLAHACRDGRGGTMAALRIDRDRLTRLLRDMPGLTLANHNAPLQSVVSGTSEDIAKLEAALAPHDVVVQRLAVAGAFHSPLVREAHAPLAEAIATVPLASPRIPVYSNVTSEPYPADPALMRRQLTEHLLSPVEFCRSVARMYDDGARVFLEVGPGTALSRLVAHNLTDRPYRCVAMDARNGALAGVLGAIGTLAVEGVPLRLESLFDDRAVREIDLSHARRATSIAKVSRTTCYLSGGSVRAAEQAVGSCGRQPFLDRETLDTNARAAAAAPVASERAPTMPPMPRAPALLPETVSATAPGGELSQALLEYQSVMRQFLVVQQNVMTRFLAGASDLETRTTAELRGRSVPAGDTRVAERALGSPPASASQRGDARASDDRPPTVAAAPDEDAPPERALDALIRIVSERTGYPADMLKLDQDIEADLGIDSIKRVEILGTLQRALPGAAAQRVKDGMERLSRAKTLATILAYVTESEASAQSVRRIEAAERAHAAPARDATEGMDAAALRAAILELVSERTGYPKELLGLDQDVEADLGIDSIKRVEILGALQKRLPPALRDRVKAGMDALTRVKTLNGIVAALHETVPVAPPPEPKLAPVDTGADPLPLARFASRMQRCEPRTTIAPREGLYLITEDDTGVAPRVALALRERGLRAHALDGQLTDEDALSAELTRLRDSQGRVSGIVHLAGLSEPVALDQFERWRAASARHVKALFRLLRLCAQDLMRDEGALLLSASGSGGTFARDDAGRTGPATAAGAGGILKSIAREWPGVRVRVVDFALSLGAERIASHVVAELRCGDDDMEVGYTSRGRFTRCAVAAPLVGAPGTLPIDADSVVLVTGGARGISAEAAFALAEYRPTLVLVGRAGLPEAVEPDDIAGAGDEASLRRRLIDRSAASTPPAQIEQRVAAVLKDREIRRNLERLRGRGARVEYVSADVRDARACANLLADLYRRHGRVDAVVHGAGIIEDRLAVDKETGQFERVYDTKADSSFALATHLRPETLRFCVFFTSVAGRFGNRGQCDYAAANETVNRLAWQLDQRWPDTRVVAINWGPWRSGGMASPEVLGVFAAQGIEAIDPQSGCRFLIDELVRGRKGDVEVIAGVGPWQALERVGRQTPPARGTCAPGLPFVRTSPAVLAGSTVMMQHVFSLASDPYLRDHRLDRAPVVPLTVALEWLAEFVQAAWPRFHVASVRELRLLKGIVLDDNALRRVQFRARSATHADANVVTVTADVRDAEHERISYGATFELNACVPMPTRVDIAPLEASTPIDVGRAYREWLFHGARFRLLTTIDGVSANGIEATATPTDPSAWLDEHGTGDRSWLFDPGLLDTAPQLAIVWSRFRNDATAIPHRVGCVARFGDGPVTGPVRVAWRVRDASSADHLAYDAAFFDSTGALRYRIENAESTCSAALNRLALQQS